MRIEDMAQSPAAAVELARDLVGVGRVDGGRESRRRIVQQKTIVVAEAGKLHDLEHAAGSIYEAGLYL